MITTLIRACVSACLFAWQHNQNPHAGWTPTNNGHMLLETVAAYRMNPMHFGLEMLAQSQNRSLHKVNTSADRVHGFATSSLATGALQLFLINKFDALQKVRVVLPPTGSAPTQLTSMVDTADHWGAVTAPQLISCVERACVLALPPLSFSMLQ